MMAMLSAEQRRLVKVVISPWLFRHDSKRAPTFDEWMEAFDALYGTRPLASDGEKQ